MYEFSIRHLFGDFNTGHHQAFHSIAEVNASATNYRVHNPFGIDFDRAGNTYIVGIAGRERVLKIDPAGQLSVLAGTGEKGDS